MKKEHKVIIVGGGFGGIRCALDLLKHKHPNLKIVLISDKTHFEYHAALYRVVTGRSPLEVCIPLEEIFKGKEIEIIKDKVNSIDLKQKKICGEMDCYYKYDSLVLALGSATDYFNVPGLEEYSYGFKSINEALALKRHLHEYVQSCTLGEMTREKCAKHIVVIGGGASGTEVAAELAVYTRGLAKNHGIDPSFIKIDLIHSGQFLVPQLPNDVSQKIENKIRSLGVNVHLNSRVIKEDLENIYMNDMQIKAKTVIWTAGVVGNRLLQTVEGLQLNKRGKIIVDEYLQPAKQQNVYVVGDCAETKYSGMAQTAILHGKYVANRIKHKVYQNKKGLEKKYIPHMPVYIIPVGPGWAAYVDAKHKICGKFGWVFRRLFDLTVFLSILPLKKAFLAFEEGRTICETCGICSADHSSNEAVSSIV